jgi:hypothetical protein
MDLRYRTKEVLRALEAREEIILTHRGTEKGKIIPPGHPQPTRPPISQLAAVGMWADDVEPVPVMVARLRKPRPC